jgi:hypothetical protein
VFTLNERRRVRKEYTPEELSLIHRRNRSAPAKESAEKGAYIPNPRHEYYDKLANAAIILGLLILVACALVLLLA